MRDFFHHVELVRAIRQYAPGEARTLVVDIGSSFGVPARVIARDPRFKVIATESALVSGDSALTFIRETFPLVNVDNLEAQSLPFRDSSVDMVLFLAIIEHLVNSPKRVLTEIHRILKPQGILIVDTPNILELRKRLLLLLGKPTTQPIQFHYNAPLNFDHHREYTLDDLTKVVTWSGFEVVEAQILDTLSGLSITKRVAPRRRTTDAAPLAQMTQFDLGFHPGRLYDWAKLPFVVLLKLFPSLRDMLLVVGRKQ